MRLPANDRDFAREVEGTYWTRRILGEFPDDTSDEMRELVDRLVVADAAA